MQSEISEFQRFTTTIFWCKSCGSFSQSFYILASQMRLGNLMRRSSILISLALMVLVLGVSSFTSLPLASSATQYSTLADALNATVNNINLSSADSWTSSLGTILSGQSISSFDNAMTQDINSGNYNDAVFVRGSQVSVDTVQQ